MTVNNRTPSQLKTGKLKKFFKEIDDKEIIAGIEKVLKESNLTPRQLDVISLRYGFFGNEKHKLEDIGKKYQVPRERIAFIDKKAFQRLLWSNKVIKVWNSML